MKWGDLPARYREQAAAKLQTTVAGTLASPRLNGDRLRNDRTELEDALAGQIRYAGLPTPVRQAKLILDRRWRWDFAWPDRQLAVEVDGGTWTGGRHTRGKGYAADCEKQAELVCAGWRTLRFTADQVNSGQAVAWIAQALAQPAGNAPYVNPSGAA